MAAHAVLEPLTDAGLSAVLRDDGRLWIGPSERLTVALRDHIREHRDQLVAALSAVHVPERQSLDWPPPEKPWFMAWMKADDERRRATMAAAMARKKRR